MGHFFRGTVTNVYVNMCMVDAVGMNVFEDGACSIGFYLYPGHHQEDLRLHVHEEGLLSGSAMQLARDAALFL